MTCAPPLVHAGPADTSKGSGLETQALILLQLDLDVQVGGSGEMGRRLLCWLQRVLLHGAGASICVSGFASIFILYIPPSAPQHLQPRHPAPLSILQAFASHIQELGVDHGSLPAFQRLREVIKAAQAGGEGQM